MIAVMGGAGHVGGKVADLLLAEIEGVRVQQHRRPLGSFAERGAEVVDGDAGDVESLRALFARVDAALVLLPEDVTDPDFEANRSRMACAIGEALGDCGVGHVVALSAVGADHDGIAGPPAGLLELERRLSERVANVLVLRSAFYMDYLLMNLPLIEAEHVNGSVVAADVPIPMIATQDVAREAAERLRRRDFSGRDVKLLMGPEEVTMREATRAIGVRVGIPTLPYLEFPAEAVEQGLMVAGMSASVARLVVEMQHAINAGAFYGGVERTREAATRTRLDDFLDSALRARSAA